ncbi:PLP-dependent transferase [Phascolarctobacterium faecium]|nr:PLP-dependent transferase [Phascolarctobacterium faecium]
MPSKMSQAELSEDEQLAAGIKPGLIRFAVGIEDAADLIADIDQALAEAKR